RHPQRDHPHRHHVRHGFRRAGRRGGGADRGGLRHQRRRAADLSGAEGAGPADDYGDGALRQLLRGDRQCGGGPPLPADRPADETRMTDLATLTPIAATGTKPILSIRDLSVSFLGARNSWTRVIEGLSFDVAPGETVALVGESGSGKSVTSLSVLGLLDPATSRLEGSILLDGHDVLKLDEAGMIRHIRGQAAAMIFQEPMTSLHPIYRVGDQIMEALTSHRDMPRAEARRQAI